MYRTIHHIHLNGQTIILVKIVWDSPMSLVPTYVLCNDGYWYKDPVWEGRPLLPDGTYSWFVCVDDDDPVELVIQDNQVANPEVFNWLDVTGTRWKHAAGRCFQSEKLVMKPGRSIWCQFSKIPPPPQRHEGKSQDLPRGECVFYDMQTWGAEPYTPKDGVTNE